MDNKNTRRGGCYWKNGKPYLSTTEIGKILDKPALRYWYAQQVYLAMVKDPTLGQAEALAAPYNAGTTARDRGITVATLVEAYKNTGLEKSDLPAEYQGYMNAFYKAVKELGIKIIENEKTVYDEENKTGGTLDLYCEIGGKVGVVDVKTGKGLYPEIVFQLSNYAHMQRQEGLPVDFVAGLLLVTGEDGKPTGNYIYAPQTENYPAFLACKMIYEEINKEKLIKIGYLEA